jgi:hypothetical protein
MMIGRCAWHPYYHRRPLWSGIVSWRGWWVRFTDGICADCLDRFRTEHRTLLERRHGSAERVTEPAA